MDVVKKQNQRGLARKLIEERSQLAFNPFLSRSPNVFLHIITFSPGCPACQANLDGWKELASTLEQKGVRVLWVSRDPIEITTDYCTKHGIHLTDTLADPPYRTFVQLGLARVPNTLLVGANGTVEKVWPGRLDQAGWNTMFAYFGERQQTASPLQSQAGANPAGCGSELSQASAKSCK